MKETGTAERKLLQLVQADSSLSLAELAERAGMSQSSAWRKIQDLESGGVIRKRVTLLDPRKLDLKLCVIAHVTLEDHHEEAVASFASVVLERPEIMECHSMSGEWDYLMRIVVADVADYERFLSHELLNHPNVATSTSHFALSRVKYTTAVPI